MRTADKQQHARQNTRQNRVQIDEGHGREGQEVIGQAQDSPLAWSGPAAAQTMGGVKLARTPIGKSAGSRTGLSFRKAPVQSAFECLTLRFASFQGFAMMSTCFVISARYRAISCLPFEWQRHFPGLPPSQGSLQHVQQTQPMQVRPHQGDPSLPGPPLGPHAKPTPAPASWMLPLPMCPTVLPKPGPRQQQWAPEVMQGLVGSWFERLWAWHLPTSRHC